MIIYIQSFFIALLATSVSLIGDIYINEATTLIGRKSVIYLILGVIIFGLSGLIWFFVFKKMNFSGVIILYMFLTVIIAVGIDIIKYQNIPDVKAWIGISLFFVGMWFLKGYLA